MARHNNRDPLRRLQHQQAVKRENQPDKKQNHYWSDLDDLYAANANSIYTATTQVQYATNILKNSEHNTSRELVTTVDGLTRDLLSLSSDLTAIKELHINKVGMIKDGDELMTAIGIYESYKSIADRLQTVIFQPMLTITEFLALASQNMAKSIAEQENQELVVTEQPA